MLCVVDSGSMVSFVTEEFYKEKLQSTCGRVQDGRMLTLPAANRLEIPYLGYLELDVEVDGVKIHRCGVLVLKDTPATANQRREVPGLLGTNVLAQIPKFDDLLQQKTHVKPRNSETSTSGFVRVAGKYPVLVPPNSVASIAVTGPACGPNALVEPISVPVPGNIQVANTLVDGSKTCSLIQVVNPTPKDVWLQPRTRLGTVRGAAKVTNGDQLEFDVRSNEVIVSCPLGAESQKPSSPGCLVVGCRLRPDQWWKSTWHLPIRPGSRLSLGLSRSCQRARKRENETRRSWLSKRRILYSVFYLPRIYFYASNASNA